MAFYEQDILPIVKRTSRAADPDTLIYIVNEANGKGFVALTGDERHEVLAVSDNGTIGNIEDIDNPGLRIFFEEAAEYASTLSGSTLPGGALDPIPYFIEELKFVHSDVCAPRCFTWWGQQYPEGLYCSNRYSGCTITATAQALSYFETPDTINLTYDDADTSYVDLNWGAMKQYVKSLSLYEYNNTSRQRLPIQQESEKNLGRLCRELGHRMHAEYASGGTAASLDEMARVVNQLCPTLQVYGRYYGAPIARNVLSDCIIIMQGSQYRSEADSVQFNHDNCLAHAWIVDGYTYNVTEHNIYVYKNGSYVYSENLSYVETIDLQHINWGWRGRCNGFFNINVFNPNAAEKPDTDSNSVSYNFNHEYSYFIISPK